MATNSGIADDVERLIFFQIVSLVLCLRLMRNKIFPHRFALVRASSEKRAAFLSGNTHLKENNFISASSDNAFFLLLAAFDYLTTETTLEVEFTARSLYGNA